jgi:hypothetical protein
VSWHRDVANSKFFQGTANTPVGRRSKSCFFSKLIASRALRVLAWEGHMKFNRRKFLHLAAGAAGLPAFTRIAWAQAYPTRPVRIVVGYAPGGPTDIVARIIGPWLSERLRQSVIIENRPGATGNIGTEAVVRAAPDGATLPQERTC